MVRDEVDGPEVPELVRRMNLVSCNHDPVPPLVKVLVEVVDGGTALGNVIADSGYAHRVPEHFALPLRAAGARLVMDLQPSDRGTQGTHQGAVCWNGNLYCRATPSGLFDLVPLARGASAEEVAAHDRCAAELARFKLGRIAAPEHPPTCCTQVTISVPPQVIAKTAQHHDYPSRAWRRSYARRSAAERSNARIKDPATIDVARGWCRVMGLTPMSLFLACALVCRNLAVADAFGERRRVERRVPLVADGFRARRAKAAPARPGSTAVTPPAATRRHRRVTAHCYNQT